MLSTKNTNLCISENKKNKRHKGNAISLQHLAENLVLCIGVMTVSSASCIQNTSQLNTSVTCDITKGTKAKVQAN